MLRPKDAHRGMTMFPRAFKRACAKAFDSVSSQPHIGTAPSSFHGALASLSISGWLRMMKSCAKLLKLHSKSALKRLFEAVPGRCAKLHCVWQVESDDYCATVIECRQTDKLIEPAPLFRDIATFVPSGDIAAMTEGLIGGFPCQTSI